MLQANLAWADTGRSTAVGCSTVGLPGMWDTMWGIMRDLGALCITMEWSTMGYYEMWHQGLPGDKDSHSLCQALALQSQPACSWELKMTQYSIAQMCGSVTSAPRDLVTPSLSPGMDLAEPWLLAQARPGMEQHSCACSHTSAAKMEPEQA